MAEPICKPVYELKRSYGARQEPNHRHAYDTARCSGAAAEEQLSLDFGEAPKRQGKYRLVQ